MTCIAWDGKTLAADKRSCENGIIGTVTKIHRVNGSLVGGSGANAFISQMIQWVRDGRKVKDFPDAQRDKDDWQPFLLIETDGRIAFYDRTPYPTWFEQQHYAIGSGRELARAAMYLGKTAREAVEVACALDCGCGNGIDVLEL